MSFESAALDLVMRVALLSLVGGALVRWVPGVSASVRHRWAMGLLVASTILVPLAALLPKFEVAVLPPVSSTATSPGLELEGGSLGILGASGLRSSLELELPPQGPAGPGSELPMPSEGPGLPVWAWVWILGSCVVATRSLGAHLAVRRLARELPEVDARAWKELVDHLRLLVGLPRPVRLMALEGPISPAAFGLVRPSVLLPRSAAAWRGEGLRQVLLHELAHLRRRDPLQRWIAELCCACFWFLPMVWGLERRMRVESERACDDLVLASGTSASGYASVLLGLQQRLRTERALLPSLACLVRKSEFEGRLDAILDPARPRGLDSGVAGALGGLALGLAALGLLVLRPVRSEASIGTEWAGVDPSPSWASSFRPEGTPEHSPVQPPPGAQTEAEAEPTLRAAGVVSIEPEARGGSELTPRVEPSVDEVAVEEPINEPIEEQGASEPDVSTASVEGGRLDPMDSIRSGAGGMHVLTLDRTQAEEPFDCERFDALAQGAEPTDEEIRQVLELAGIDLGGLLDHAQVQIVPVLVPARESTGPRDVSRSDRSSSPVERPVATPSRGPTERRTQVPSAGASGSPAEVELWARERHKDHLRATYNFGFATRDDREATRNNWDLQMRGYKVPYEFDVNMAGSDRSRIADLGRVRLDSVDLAPRYVEALSEDEVRVVAGHSYLIHTVDSRSDYWTRLHVLEVTEDGTCRFEWQMLLDETPDSVRRHP